MSLESRRKVSESKKAQRKTPWNKGLHVGKGVPWSAARRAAQTPEVSAKLSAASKRQHEEQVQRG